jgi:hypothetical protein
VWTTPPTTPTSHHRGNQDSSKGDSEKATEGSRERGQVPKHISSSGALTGVVKADSSHGYPHIPDMVVSPSAHPPDIVSPSTHSPSRIHRGFVLDEFDTTKSDELPGSRGTVITTPPHPQASKGGPETRPRARSIEEADKHREKYVPSSNSSVGGVKEESSSYCLGLSSLILSQEGGRVGEASQVPGGRKTSATSETSTISVSDGERDPVGCYVSILFYLPVGWELSRSRVH